MNFFRDLGAADFAAYEDKQPQEVLQGQLVDLNAGRVTTVPWGSPEAGGDLPVAPVPDPQPIEPDSRAGVSGIAADLPARCCQKMTNLAFDTLRASHRLGNFLPQKLSEPLAHPVNRDLH